MNPDISTSDNTPGDGKGRELAAAARLIAERARFLGEQVRSCSRWRGPRLPDGRPRRDTVNLLEHRHRQALECLAVVLGQGPDIAFGWWQAGMVPEIQSGVPTGRDTVTETLAARIDAHERAVQRLESGAPYMTTGEYSREEHIRFDRECRDEAAECLALVLGTWREAAEEWLAARSARPGSGKSPAADYQS